MSDYIISTTSTADLSESYAKEHQLYCLPYLYMIQGREYKDDFGHSLSYKDFYQSVREGNASNTSLVNADTYRQYFSQLLEKGQDILHIEFSSALTGSVTNAKNVAKELNEKNENQIYVVDSLCASLGQGLLVDYAIRHKNQGESIQQVIDWLEANKQHIIHWFTVDDLNHLRRGGRVSGISAFLGTMLKIKPILDVDDQGRLIPHFKVRGRKKAISGMVDKMKEDILNPDGQTVFISHGDCQDEAEYLAKLVKEAFPTIGDIFIHYIGPVIGSHSGPGTIALFYVGKQRY